MRGRETEWAAIYMKTVMLVIGREDAMGAGMTLNRSAGLLQGSPRVAAALMVPPASARTAAAAGAPMVPSAPRGSTTSSQLGSVPQVADQAAPRG